jgi:UDP-glucose 4-epimerase
VSNKRLSGKRILVLGGAGFIGSHLVEGLSKTDAAEIVVADSFFLGNQDNLEFKSNNQKLDVVRVDASDYAALCSLVISRKIDVVFNLAVIPLPTSLSFPSWTVSSNIAIATNCCELVRNGLAERLVHLSSSEVYGSASYVPMDENHPYNPSTPYAASKVAGDQVVLSYRHTFGIDAIVARPFNNYGPKQNSGSYAGIIPIILRRALDGIEIEIYGDGEQTRDYVFVTDSAEHVILLANLEIDLETAVNISTGVETSVNDLVATVQRLLGKEIRTKKMPDRLGDVRRHSGDPSLLRSLTNSSPRAINDADLEKTIDWYKRAWHDHKTE